MQNVFMFVGKIVYCLKGQVTTWIKSQVTTWIKMKKNCMALLVWADNSIEEKKTS